MHDHHPHHTQQLSSKLPPLADSARVDCFSTAGRKIGVGDCALFQARNAPPFIGIIRKLFSVKEGQPKLCVNWLYRPGDVKLGKGVSLKAAPNEIFYSFHKDELYVASLLHPCKVAFLRKGVELPSGVSSFVCRRVYDTSNKCLYWLTDQDYTDEHQQEVDQLLHRTMNEIQAAEKSSQRALSGSMSLEQSKDDVKLNVSSHGEGRGKKRERTDQSLDVCKRDRPMKINDSSLGHLKGKCHVKLEDINVLEKDRQLTNISDVGQLLDVMRQEQIDSLKKSGDSASRRMFLASIIAGTEREDCLKHFIHLGGLPVLDEWLQEARKGKVGDCGNPKEGDKALEELLLTLIQALDKLPVDLDALKTCKVGKSVNNLRSHKNFEIQKRARKLVEIWKQRVDAQIKSSGELKSDSNSATPWSCKQPSIVTNGTKGRAESEEGNLKSSARVKSIFNGSPGDSKYNLTPVSRCKEPQGFFASPVPSNNLVKSDVTGTSEILVAARQEEKISSSSQSQKNSSASANGAGPWKEEGNTLAAVSTAIKTHCLTQPSLSHLVKDHVTQSLTGFHQDSACEIHCTRNKTSGSEAVAGSPVMEMGADHVENSNNKSCVVSLPNPLANPDCSASRGSLADGGSPARSYSSGWSERQYLVDGMRKALSTVASVCSPGMSGDTHYTNGSGSGVKYGNDSMEEKERPCLTSVDVDCKSSDDKCGPKDIESSFHFSNVYAGKVVTDGLQGGIVKEGAASARAALGSTDISKGMKGLDSNSNEGVMDVRAGCEGSEIDKSFSGNTEVGEVPFKESSKDLVKQARHLNKQESKNHYEDLIVMAQEGDGNQENGLSVNSCVQVFVKPDGTGERVDTGSLYVQESRVLREDSKEQPGVLVAEQSLEKKAEDGVLESTLFSRVEYGGANVARGETTRVVGVGMSRLRTEVCDSSSLSIECQTADLDNNGYLEEGSKDANQAAISGPRSLVKMPSIQDTAKVGDSCSGSHHNALELASQMDQEVEQCGRSEGQGVNAMHFCMTTLRHVSPGHENGHNPTIFTGKVDASVEDFEKNVNFCTAESRHSSPGHEKAHNPPIFKGEVDARVKSLDQDRHRTDTVVYSGNGLATKMEEMEAVRILLAREGKELDHASCPLFSPEKLRQALGLAHRFVFDYIDRGVKGAILGEYNHFPPSGFQKDSLDTRVCSVQAAEVPTVDQVISLTFSLRDGKCGVSDSPGRLVFDLNEKNVSDGALDDAAPSGSLLSPSVIFPDLLPGPPARPSSLAAPVAVMAAKKGAFIPLSNVLRGKGKLGWKGSAPTSAFRPAEPRCTVETLQLPATSASFICQSAKQGRILDIDLNVADEGLIEDICDTSMRSGCELFKATVNKSFTSGGLVNCSPVLLRPELDLNRVDDNEKIMGSVVSGSRFVELSGRCNNELSAATGVIKDFDLNGPGFEQLKGEESPFQHKNLQKLASSVLPGTRSNLGAVNVASWYPATNALPTIVTPPFSMSSAEPLYHSSNGDLHQASARVPFSSAVSYSTTVPAAFPNAGLPLGSGFPFNSVSHSMSSLPYVVSTNSPSLPTVSSQLVSAGAIVSPYQRPYLVGITDVAGAEPVASWSRPDLDLNAGPDAFSTDARQVGCGTRQMPRLGELSFQQAELLGGSIKRDEPEGGINSFRSVSKQMTWL